MCAPVWLLPGSLFPHPYYNVILLSEFCKLWSYDSTIQGVAFQVEAILYHTAPLLLISDGLRFLRSASKGPSGSDLLWCHDFGSEAGDRRRVVVMGWSRRGWKAGLVMSEALLWGSPASGAGGEIRALSAFCISLHSCLAQFLAPNMF